MSDLKPVSFVVPGEPQGKGRPRIGKVGNHARMFTPTKTVAYEGLVALAAQDVMQGRELLQGAVMVEMKIFVSIPQSMSKKRKAQALAGQIFPTKKPDVDNVEKAIFDAINGVVWKDDVQVVDVFKRKRYGETPGVLVRIVPLEGDES
ncbi:Endodeoxyribonuclease RusA [compost metagenome]